MPLDEILVGGRSSLYSGELLPKRPVQFGQSPPSGDKGPPIFDGALVQSNPQIVQPRSGVLSQSAPGPPAAALRRGLPFLQIVQLALQKVDGRLFLLHAGQPPLPLGLKL